MEGPGGGGGGGVTARGQRRKSAQQSHVESRLGHAAGETKASRGTEEGAGEMMATTAPDRRFQKGTGSAPPER